VDQDHFAAKARSRAVRLRRNSDVDQLVAGYRAGKTVRQLAADLGVNRQTISRHLKAAGVQLRFRPLTAEQIERAAPLYAEGGLSGTLCKWRGLMSAA
jgi:IS30 family transposase